MALSALLATAAPVSAETLTEVTGFGSNPGNLQMFTYVPYGLPADRPIVVYLHGCNPVAADADEESGWVKWADERKFAIVFPQQKAANNLSRCFNWYEPADTTRGSGEVLSVKQMVDWVTSHQDSNRNRVYVTGVSAGAGMTIALLATYPDVFMAGQTRQAGPYRCASNLVDSSGCTTGLTTLTPQQWGDRVRSASGWTGPWPRLSIWHGSSDTAVSPNELTELMKQWTNLHGISQSPSAQEIIKGSSHKIYNNDRRRAVVETFLISGAAHGEFIDPGPGLSQCGIPANYILDVDFCASVYALRWFGL